MIRSFIIALAASIGLTTATYAGDFDDTQFTTTVTSGNLQFTIDTTARDNFNSLNVGAYIHEYRMGNFFVELYGEVGYNRLTDTMNLLGEYQVYTALNSNTTMYGALAVNYVTPTNDLSNGDFYFQPYVGVTHSLTLDFVVFGEVGYSWDMSNSWANNGGYGEIGFHYHVNDTLTVTPSIVHYFDTGMDLTQAKLAVTLSF
jgi:hypothetical protein